MSHLLNEDPIAGLISLGEKFRLFLRPLDSRNKNAVANASLIESRLEIVRCWLIREDTDLPQLNLRGVLGEVFYGATVLKIQDIPTYQVYYVDLYGFLGVGIYVEVFDTISGS